MRRRRGHGEPLVFLGWWAGLGYFGFYRAMLGKLDSLFGKWSLWGRVVGGVSYGLLRFRVVFCLTA